MSENKVSDPKQPNHFKDLLLLFSIPIAIALLTAGIVYIPRWLANPTYDFMYVTCSSYGCSPDYSVDSNGRVAERAVDNASEFAVERTPYTIHYYEAAKDSTKTLTLDEAQRYKLNTSSKSPEGYTLAQEQNSGGFLFWGSYDSGWYLKDGLKKKSITLTNGGSYYSSGVVFLGWVEK